MKILPSALKHKVTEADILDLIDSMNYTEILLSPGKLGERYMIVGFVTGLNYPIEVGIEYPPDESDPIVFHADKAREPYISALKGE